MINSDKNKFNIIITGITISCGVLFFILYLPLVKQLKIERADTRTVEAELLKARNIVAFMKTTGNNVQLATGDNFTVVLDALIKRGGLYNINYISTKSEDPVQDEIYTMFPINVVLHSRYQDLGNFLGSLDDLDNVVVKVKEFEISPISGDVSNLRTKLTLNMYLLK